MRYFQAFCAAAILLLSFSFSCLAQEEMALDGPWSVSHVHPKLGVIKGKAEFKGNGASATLVLERNFKTYPLTSTKVMRNGAQLTIQLTGQLPEPEGEKEPVTGFDGGRALGEPGAALLNVSPDVTVLKATLKDAAIQAPINAPHAKMITVTLKRTAAGKLEGQWSQSGIDGKETASGQQSWERADPVLIGAVVIEQQASVQDGVISYQYPFDNPGKGTVHPYRKLLLYGHNLPQEHGAQYKISGTDDKIRYFYNGTKETAKGDPYKQELLKWGAEKLSGGFDDYDVVFVRADLQKGVLPGIKTVSLNGMSTEWSLEFGDSTGKIVFSRQVREKFEHTDVALPMEHVRVQVESDVALPIAEIPVIVGKNGDPVKLGGKNSLLAKRVGGEKSKIYRTRPISLQHATRKELQAPPQPNQVVLPVKSEDTLVAKIETEGLLRTDPVLAKVTIIATPDRLGALWKAALDRTATCKGLKSYEWNKMAQKEADEIWNAVLFTWEIRSIKVRFGDQAAMILLRDTFVEMMNGVLGEYRKIRASDELVAKFRKMMKGMTDDSIPFNTVKVKAPDGVPVSYSYIHYADLVMEDGKLSREQYEKWAHNATKIALDTFIASIETSIAKANAAGDCNNEELLKITGYGFDLVAKKLLPRLMKLKEEGSPVTRMYWEPDNVARGWVSTLNVLADAVRAQEDMASVDNTMIALSLAAVSMGASAVLGPGVLGTVVALGIDAADMAFTLATDVPDYFDSQNEIEFARGARVVLGSDRYNKAKLEETSWYGTALGVLGAGAGSAFSAFDAISAVSKARKVRNGQKLLAKAINGGVDSLSDAEKADVFAFLANAKAKELAKGGDKLSNTEKAGLAWLDDTAAKAPTPRPKETQIASAEQGGKNSSPTHQSGGKSSSPSPNKGDDLVTPSKPKDPEPIKPTKSNDPESVKTSTTKGAEPSKPVKPEKPVTETSPTKTPEGTKTKTDKTESSTASQGGKSQGGAKSSPTRPSDQGGSGTKRPTNQSGEARQPTNRQPSSRRNDGVDYDPARGAKGTKSATTSKAPPRHAGVKGSYKDRGLPDIRPDADVRRLPDTYLTDRERKRAQKIWDERYKPKKAKDLKPGEESPKGWRTVERDMLDGKLTPTEEALLKGMYREEATKIAKKQASRKSPWTGRYVDEDLARMWQKNPRLQKKMLDDAIADIARDAAEGNETAAAFMAHYRANGFKPRLDPRIDARGLTPGERKLDPDYDVLMRGDPSYKGLEEKSVRQFYANPFAKVDGQTVLRSPTDVAGTLLHEFTHKMGYGELRAWKDQLDFLSRRAKDGTDKMADLADYAGDLAKYGDKKALENLRGKLQDRYKKLYDQKKLDATTAITPETMGAIKPPKNAPSRLRDMINEADDAVERSLAGAEDRLGKLRDIEWRHSQLSLSQQERAMQMAEQMRKMGVPEADALDYAVTRAGSFNKGATVHEQAAAAADGILKNGSRPVSFEDFVKGTGLPASSAKVGWEDALKRNGLPPQTDELMPSQLGGKYKPHPAEAAQPAKAFKPHETAELKRSDIFPREKTAGRSNDGPDLEPMNGDASKTEVMKRPDPNASRTEVMAKSDPVDPLKSPVKPAQPDDPKLAKLQERADKAGDEAVREALRGQSPDRVYDDVAAHSGDPVTGDDILRGPITEGEVGDLSRHLDQQGIDDLFRRPGDELTSEDLAAKADALLDGRKPSWFKGGEGQTGTGTTTPPTLEETLKLDLQTPRDGRYGYRTMNKDDLADLAKNPQVKVTPDRRRISPPGSDGNFKPKTGKPGPDNDLISIDEVIEKSKAWNELPEYERLEFDQSVLDFIDEAAAVGDKWARRLQEQLADGKVRYSYDPRMHDKVDGYSLDAGDIKKGTHENEFVLNPLTRDPLTGWLVPKNPAEMAEAMIHEFVHGFKESVKADGVGASKGLYNEARAFIAERVFRKNVELARGLNGKPYVKPTGGRGEAALESVKATGETSPLKRGMMLRQEMEKHLLNDNFYKRYYPTLEEQVKNLSATGGGSRAGLENEIKRIVKEIEADKTLSDGEQAALKKARLEALFQARGAR